MDCNIIRRSSVIPVRPSSSGRVFDIHMPNVLKLSRSKRPNLARHRLVVANAFGFDQNASVEGFPFIPGKHFMEEAIGAEYGEGFETFRQDGPLKVDVDFLNERLQEGFLQRIRYAMKPDEAFGLIFSWDNVVADSSALKFNAWKQLASEEGKEIPDDDVTQRQMLYATADHVLNKILLWEKSESELDLLKLRLSHLYYENLQKLDKSLEGLEDWLEAVSTARIPCAVVSSIDRKNMVEALERMGIKKYFQAIVSEEDGMESIAHRFLSAALKGRIPYICGEIRLAFSSKSIQENHTSFTPPTRTHKVIVYVSNPNRRNASSWTTLYRKLDRKPAKCVVFEDDPRGVAAAHNCTMMAVALIGSHPAYELVQADLAVGNFSELSVINLRRLFAHKGFNFMDLQKQIVEKSPPKRKLSIDTIF